MRRLAALLLALSAAAAVAAAALAAQSPQALRSAILKATVAQRSVHYVSKNQVKGGSLLMVCDVGPGVGVQRIVFKTGGSVGAATILVVRRTAYFRADRTALVEYFGLTKAQAKRYAQTWISVTPTSKAYASLAADATFESFAADLLPKQHLAVVRDTIGGKRVLGLRGQTTQAGVVVAETIYAPARGRQLPVKEVAVAKGQTSVVTMSNWGEAVHVKAPAHSVPLAKVTGHGGGGGGPIA